MIAAIPPGLRLPAAIALAFGILALTGLIWTPFAPGVRDWIAPDAGADRPQGFVLGTVILLPMLLVVWSALRLVPRIRRLDSRGLLALFAVSAAATLAWRLFGPEGSPDLSYLLALAASWFILLNR